MSGEGTVFDRWWPATQSLDLIGGQVTEVAPAVAEHFREIARYSDDEIATEWRRFADIDAAFQSVPYFDNAATHLLLLPTRSRWCVMWTNTFLCDGYDSFMSGLTRTAGLTTIHWSAHDATTTFQPGATFHLRRMRDGQISERIVQASRTDRRWDFFEIGTPLPEEDLDGYRARRTRDRLNEHRVMELLARLDAHPWDEAWYRLPDDMVYRLERPLPPPAIRRDRGEVVTGRH